MGKKNKAQERKKKKIKGFRARLPNAIEGGERRGTGVLVNSLPKLFLPKWQEKGGREKEVKIGSETNKKSSALTSNLKEIERALGKGQLCLPNHRLGGRKRGNRREGKPSTQEK